MALTRGLRLQKDQGMFREVHYIAALRIKNKNQVILKTILAAVEGVGWNEEMRKLSAVVQLTEHKEQTLKRYVS